MINKAISNETSLGENDGKKPMPRFSVMARSKSISYAIAGLAKFFREEHNARVHLVATIGVGILSWYLGVTILEVLSLVIVTGMVWMAEIFNTSIERIMDHISPARCAKVKYIKDLSAAAVLVASIIAVVTGGIIFIPKFF